MENGNGRDHSQDAMPYVPESSGDATLLCICGWTASGPTDRAALGVLVAHATGDHHVIARRPMPEFNAGFAQNAAKRCFERAAFIERKLAASPIAGPSGAPSNQIDVAAQMVHFVREVSLALTSIIDLLLESRTGVPCLNPDPASPKTAGSHAAR